MKSFETIIKVSSNGCDPFDAGERAGEIFDIFRMEDGMTLSCEPTQQLNDLFVSVFRIVNDGEDLYDAGEKAGDIIDNSRIENDMYISCEPTREYGDNHPYLTV